MNKIKLSIRYTLCAILLSIVLTSCDGYNELECYKSVQKAFPEAIEIKQPIGVQYTFLVKDKDGLIYYVKTMNKSNTDITHKELIFK